MVEITNNLRDRIAESHANGWTARSRAQISLNGAAAKLTGLDRMRARDSNVQNRITDLGIPVTNARPTRRTGLEGTDMSGDDQTSPAMPDAEQARGIIKILVQAFANLTSAGQVVVPSANQQVFGAVFGWWAWISRSSQLVLLAHDAGFGHESTPSVRSIMEHALVMQWVVDVGDDALAAVASADDKRRLKLFNELNKVGWGIPDGATKPEVTPHELASKFGKFDALCEAYGVRGQYVPYRILSNDIHPTAMGANAYVGSEGTLSDHPDRELSKFSSGLVHVAISLIQAAKTINSLLDNTLLTEVITCAEAQFGAEIARPTLNLDSPLARPGAADQQR